MHHMCVGEATKQENLTQEMRIFKRREGMSQHFTQDMAMVVDAQGFLLNTMRILAYKLGGYGDVQRKMEREGNPQASMKA